MKKNKVISSLNKRSTENMTAAVLPGIFSTAKSGQRFEDHSELSWLDVHCLA